MTTVQWAEHSSEELASSASRAVVLVPIGATEQHGPHLPVGTDHVVAAEVARRVAEATTTPERPVLVTPVIPVGSSHHHLPRPGTISLSAATTLAVLRDVLDSLSITGVRRVLIVNGHGGNDDVIRQAVRDVTLTRPLVAGATSYWTPATADLAALADGFPVPGHAGSFETSVVLALAPHLVGEARPGGGHPESVPPLTGAYIERHRWIDEIGGSSDDASRADAELGERFLTLITEAIAATVRDLAAHPEPWEGSPS